VSSNSSWEDGDQRRGSSILKGRNKRFLWWTGGGKKIRRGEGTGGGKAFQRESQKGFAKEDWETRR